MANLNDSMNRPNPIINENRDDVRVTPITEGEDPNEAMNRQIQRATGLDINPAEAMAKQQRRQAQQKPADDLPVPKPVARQTAAPAAGSIVDPESMEQALAQSELKDEDFKPLNVGQMVQDRAEEKIKAAEKAESDEFLTMFKNLAKDEDARLARAEEVMDGAKKGDEVFKKSMEKAAEGATPSNGSAQIADAIAANPIENFRVRQRQARSNDSDIDPYDLMPSYTEDEEDKKNEKGPSAEEETPDSNNLEEFNRFLRDLPESTVEPSTEPEPVTRVRTSRFDRATKTVSGLGDQAFMNAVTRFKRDTCSKVTVPLVNSGFFADETGTGVVDLQNLYAIADIDGITQEDYDLEKMRTVIKNVTGTNPRINPGQVAMNIHYADFDMLAYAHVCATIEEVQSVFNCTHCGKPFRILVKNPTDMLINREELLEKANAIRNAPNIEQNSLMTFKRTITTDDGFEITMAHPSYAEVVAILRGLDDVLRQLSTIDRRRFGGMLKDTLYFIRSIKMPNGVISNGLYQHYIATTMMTPENLDLVIKEAENLRKKIIHPRFGIRSVICPHCHRENKDITFTDLYDLVFYHTTVKRALSQASTDQSNSD